MRLLLATAEPLALVDGTLSAQDVCALVAEAWGGVAAGDVDTCALSTGTAGFLRSLAPFASEEVATVARDTAGREVPVTFRLGPPSAAGARTAYVEAALLRASRTDGSTDQSDLGTATSYGVGQVVGVAARLASRVVVATGDLGAHDAGAGTIAALAGLTDGPLVRGGDLLGEVTARDAAAVAAARAALGAVELVGAVEGDLPLLGLHGASGALAAASPAAAARAQELERAHGHFAHEVVRALEGTERRDLLSGPTTSLALAGRPAPGVAARAVRALAGLPGAGAGGGLGFGLAALGARLLPGTAVVAEAVGLEERIDRADLAVVVVDSLGASATHDGALPEVARRAAARGVPVVVLAREVLAGRREQAAAGISGAYVLGDDLAAVRARVERVARTWAGRET